MLKNYDIKKHFPIFKNNKKLVYLDSAATSQMPKESIEMLKKYYSTTHSNIHRGAHKLGDNATKLVEKTRIEVKKLINAKFSEECIFLKGTTEALNLLASCLKDYLKLKKNNIILTTVIEHHANLLPWKFIADNTGCKVKILKIKKNGTIDLKKFKKELNKNVKILTITHVSNVLGIINPIEKIIKLTEKYKIITIIDGAQSIQHLSIDVQKINCDFFVFSGHKMYGPTGVGILYGKIKLLQKFHPYQGGGGIIADMDIEKNKYIFHNIPQKLEPGTPDIAAIITLAKSIKFIKRIKNIITIKEHDILEYLIQNLKKIKNINILGTSKNKISIISFTHKYIHAHDIGSILNSYDIAVRTGHLCCIPLLKFYKCNSVVRISIGIYNDYNDIDHLIFALKIAIKTFEKNYYKKL